MEPEIKNSSPAVPIAIIFGFAMIAIAIFFTSKDTVSPSPVLNQATSEKEGTVTDSTPRTVDETDYIRGNPNAPILIIEYSDYECPFCKQYHETLKRIMDQYGVNGKIAWVYRQFPIVQLHPNAGKISEAALCVGEIGGNDAFWKFSDMIFLERDIDAPTNVTRLPQYAVDAGITKEEYIECLDSGRNEEKVLASVEEGFRIGARGTPHTVLIVGDQQAVISGAQPYSIVQGIVQNLIDQLEGTAEPTPSSPTPIQ